MTSDRLAIEYVPAGSLTLHPENPRQGDVGAIHTSITHNGVYTAVVAQKSTGRIIVGNHRYLAMVEAGLEDIPVIWRDVDDETARRIMVADNRASDLATNDEEALAALLRSMDSLEGTLYDEDDLDDLLMGAPSDRDEDKYTRDINVPQYTPTMDKAPPVRDLYDRRKTDRLESAIMKANDLPPEVRGFLTAAAQRHTVFNYSAIAEFYAHADPDTQALMEESALVIIDLDDAIANGFTTLETTLARLRDDDRRDRGDDITEVPSNPDADSTEPVPDAG